MGKGLRKVTYETFLRIVFFRQKLKIVAESKKLLEVLMSLFSAALQNVDIHQPEVTSEEGALARGQTIIHARCVIANKQSVTEKVFFNRLDCPGNALIRNRQKAD